MTTRQRHAIILIVFALILLVVVSRGTASLWNLELVEWVQATAIP